jgi:hypothetical protein
VSLTFPKQKMSDVTTANSAPVAVNGDIATATNLANEVREIIVNNTFEAIYSDANIRNQLSQLLSQIRPLRHLLNPVHSGLVCSCLQLQNMFAAGLPIIETDTLNANIARQELAVFERQWKVLNDDFVAAEKAMTELSLQKHASDTRIEVLEKALADEKEKGKLIGTEFEASRVHHSQLAGRIMAGTELRTTLQNAVEQWEQKYNQLVVWREKVLDCWTKIRAFYG